MMAGVWFGAMYGGSTDFDSGEHSGEAASVVTCIDGLPDGPKRKGRSGSVRFSGRFLDCGTIGIVGLQIFGPALGNAALSFGPPNTFPL